jgi:hypothetical protein
MRPIGLLLSAAAALGCFGGFDSSALANDNDECFTATTLVPGVPVAFDTATATPSADPAPTNDQCDGTFLDWGTNNPDVWFKFTPAETGVADFSTCSPGVTDGDTSMALYTGSCGALTQVACNGDAPAEDACQPYFSKIADFEVTAGTDYFLRVGGWQGSAVQASITATFTAALDCGAGDCRTPHGGPGCSDVACCNAVCAANPLCCDPAFGWDAQCVQDAVAYCGFYIYTCEAPAGSNDCATGAQVVTVDGTYTLDTTGFNTDGPSHSGAICNSGSDHIWNDCWFRFVAPANGIATFSLCDLVTFDSKIALYDLGTEPGSFDFNDLDAALVSCIDDGANGAPCFLVGGSTPYASELKAEVTAGRTFLLRIGGYDSVDAGSGAVELDLPEPCVLDAPTASEGEPCGADTNGGCDSTTPASTVIAAGQIISGTYWAENNARDTDWYSLSVGNGSNVTVTVKANSFNRVLILGGACGSTATLASSTSACGTVANACLNAGSYYIFVGPADAAGNALFNGLPCGSGVFNNYTISVTSQSAQCPTVVTPGQCADGGPDSATLNSSAVLTSNLVLCRAQPAFPNCASGYSTNNSYARTMSSSVIPGGQIRCVRMGLYSVRRGTNAAGTGCGLFVSDLPLPATVGIYKDTDGGAPRLRNDGTNGGDLAAIDSRAILMAGQTAISPVSYDPPLCIADAAGSNIVVVIDFPSTQNGDNGVPANAGYQMMVAGNGVDAGGSQTYCQLGPCVPNPEFVLTETLGATFTGRWYVQVNGDFSTCEPPDCKTDSDADGVPNCADDCPLDPFKIAPGVCGCGVVDVDCNANNVCDSIELTVPGLDTNANGKLDACERLYGDLNLDGTVNASDFALQLAYWGAANPPVGDLDQDGDVDGADIAILLGNWGTAP